PAPSSAAISCARAKASPTSRRLTSRNAGGRSSAGANGLRTRVSVGMALRRRKRLLYLCLAWRTLIATHRRWPVPPGDLMSPPSCTILLCSCDDTMSPDAERVARVCRGATIGTAHQLCRAELRSEEHTSELQSREN